jgi:uncharacterized protein (DUF58 family)
MLYSPTRWTLVVTLGLVALAIVGLFDPSLRLVWVAAVGAFLLVMLLDAVLLPRGVPVRLERELPSEVPVATEFTARVVLVNPGRDTLAGALYDEVPHGIETDRSPLKFRLRGGREIAWTLEMSAHDRGRYQFRRATVVLYGPLRLMRRIVQVEAPAAVTAIPGIEVLRSNELILRAARDADAGVTLARGIGRGGEFESLAPYVPGDPPQSVDWKAYARTGQLAVRRYIPERRRNIMLACDAGRLMGMRVGNVRKLDLALAALMRVAAAALQRGDLVGLIIFDGEVRHIIPPRGGSGQLSRLVRASLHVGSDHTETAFTPAFVQANQMLVRRSMILLATDFDNDAQGWDLQRNMAQLVRRHAVIVAAVRDPVYHQTLAAEVRTPEHAYRQLSALTLLEERLSVLAGIRAGGVHVIDAEPHEITGPMLNTYGSLVASGAF